MFEDLAKSHGSHFFLFLIRADEALIRKRLEKPRPDSEAGLEVYEKLKREFEEVEPNHLFIPSGEDNLAAMLEQAKKFIKSENEL